MRQYKLQPLPTLPSIAVQERKVIEKARKLERDSYLAMMRRKRQLQVKVKDLFSAEL